MNDATKPPTQDNIKQIIEMKFPPDAISEEQKYAYEMIAGDPRKFRTLKPGDCNCDSPDPAMARIPVESIGWAAAIAALLLFIGTGGRTPIPAPL